MIPSCAGCGNPIGDEDDVVAVVLATLHDIPSPVSYAITRPTHCYELHHRKCGEDWLSMEAPE